MLTSSKFMEVLFITSTVPLNPFKNDFFTGKDYLSKVTCPLAFMESWSTTS